MVDYPDSLLDGERKTTCDLYLWVNGGNLEEAAVVRMTDLIDNKVEHLPVEADDGIIAWTSTCDTPLGKSCWREQRIPKGCVTIVVPRYANALDTPRTDRFPVGNGGAHKSKRVTTMWNLPQGTPFPENLGAYNDHDKHVTICPPHNESLGVTEWPNTLNYHITAFSAVTISPPFEYVLTMRAKAYDFTALWDTDHDKDAACVAAVLEQLEFCDGGDVVFEALELRDHLFEEKVAYNDLKGDYLSRMVRVVDVFRTLLADPEDCEVAGRAYELLEQKLESEAGSVRTVAGATSTTDAGAPPSVGPG
eukprot:m.15502 g.15502  ORF g.15502 m.15502 type:complete len:306 (+) comp3277_c0_seq1:183-1100(+)